MLVIVIISVIILALFAFAIEALYRWNGFSVQSKETQLSRLLPQKNCQLCHYTSCDSYLQAIFDRRETQATLCLLQNSFERYYFMLNLSRFGHLPSFYKEQSLQVATVLCGGDYSNNRYRFNYNGLPSCVAMHKQLGSARKCLYGCLGQGDCLVVCPVGAISLHKGLAKIDNLLCTACGACLNLCPTQSIALVPREADYIIACRSTDEGDVTANNCDKGCTACAQCQKALPLGGFTIKNNLCSINYQLIGKERWMAAEQCKSGCLRPFSQRELARYANKQAGEQDI
jgi:Na+-translocating ferredoxin:NAD+ oxidoreductase RNF subunit RnfB